MTGDTTPPQQPHSIETPITGKAGPAAHRDSTQDGEGKWEQLEIPREEISRVVAAEVDLDKINRDTRTLVIELAVLAAIGCVAAYYGPQGNRLIFGFYMLSIYGGWKFISNWSPLESLVKMITQILTALSTWWMPDYAKTVVGGLYDLFTKLLIAFVFGVFLTPIRVIWVGMLLIGLQRARSKIIESTE